MKARGSSAVVGTLARIYPEEVVREQLRQLYCEQIWGVIDEIYEALAGYKAHVDAAAYIREKDKVMVLVGCLHESEDRLDLQGLETLLEHLLERKRVLAHMLSFSNP
jgi:hypothetical protein